MQEGSIVRRRSDGSIDFDFYRLEATALRREALRDRLKLRAFLTFGAITVAALVTISALSVLRDADGETAFAPRRPAITQTSVSLAVPTIERAKATLR